MLVYRRKIFSVMDRNLNNIQEYTEEDLKNPEIIQFLCNDYYFYDVHITKSGWDFLISHYGYDGLYAIDKSCQFGFCRCHDDSSPEAYRKWIQERIAEYPHVLR
ncbi:MAG: hypothetical protein E7496_12220 [Ruminococcus sp.]|nr:hypothetical protein [Ruminococcus sp.]